MMLGCLACLGFGCGVTGATTRVEINLNTLPREIPIHRMHLESLAVDTTGVQLSRVGIVHPWGNFHEHDRHNIQASIEEALAIAEQQNQTIAEDPIRIHILMRKYLLRTSTDFIAVFSAVEWAAVATQKDVIYQDSFYATAYCEVPEICTLGSVKGRITSAIAERISKRTILLAMGKDPTTVTIEHTYETHGEAAMTMRAKPRSILATLLFGQRRGDDGQEAWIESARLKNQTNWEHRIRISGNSVH